MFLGKNKSNEKITFYRDLPYSSPKIETFIGSLPIHAIQLVLPYQMRLPEKVRNILEPSENAFFAVHNVSLTDLIDETFIEAFVKTGAVSAVTRCDAGFADSIVSISPSGHLLVSLKNSICLALEEVSSGQKKSTNSRNYSINLKSLKCISSSKFYCRVLTEFDKISYLKFSLILKWKPNDPKICPSSIQEYFTSKNFQCDSLLPKHTHQVRYSVPVPECHIGEAIESDEKELLLEWIGAQVCGIDCTGESEKYVSNFSISDSKDTASHVYVGHWRGFFAKEVIAEIINEASSQLDHLKDLKFLAILLHGFRDGWYFTHNQYQSNRRSKFLCIIVFPNKRTSVFSFNNHNL